MSDMRPLTRAHSTALVGCCLLAVGCTAQRVTRPALGHSVSQGVNSSSGDVRVAAATVGGSGRSVALVADRELLEIVAGLNEGVSSVMTAMSVTLAVGGATEVTGDRAPAETMRSAQLLVFNTQSAIVLLRTSCGNTRIMGLVRAAALRWRVADVLSVVPPAVPGGCVNTTVQAQPIALRSDVATEAAIGVKWEDQMGDEVHGPSLWVATLDPSHGFVVLLQQAPFGGTDDRTGASTEGSLAVMDELPAPRPMFVEIYPARRGTAGPAHERIVRRYELRAGRLEMVDEQRNALQTDGFSRPGNGGTETDAVLPMGPSSGGASVPASVPASSPSRSSEVVPLNRTGRP